MLGLVQFLLAWREKILSFGFGFYLLVNLDDPPLMGIR
jgi:hypothetical protein